MVLRGWREGRALARSHAERQATVREAVARGAAHIGNERDVHELMHAAGRSDLTGWEQIRDGMWTRPIAEGIRAVVRTSPLKGTKYQLLWGLSLAWVPHITSTGTSLHRTAKSARLDIYQEGQHHDALVRFEWGEGGAVIWLPAEVGRAWRSGFERAGEYFARAVDADAVLTLAEEQMEDDWAMTVHVPGPVYVAAFTLAHLGRDAEARAMLERQIGKWYLHLPDSHTSPRAAEKLEAALERILRRS